MQNKLHKLATIWKRARPDQIAQDRPCGDVSAGD